MNKECRPSVKVRKHDAKRPAVSKTAQLEEKVDGIVSLLRSAAQSGSVAPNPNATTVWNLGRDNNIQANRTTSLPSQVDGSSNDVPYDYPPYPTLLTPTTTGSESTFHHSPASGVPGGFEPSLHEAEEFLRIFRTQKSKYFPFIYIPSTTSAQQLFQERPFLWLCIMAMSSNSTSQQLALGSRIRNIVGRKMVLENEKKLELLLGLLAYIGWFVAFRISNSCLPILTLPSGPAITCKKSLPCPFSHNLLYHWYLTSASINPCQKTRMQHLILILMDVRNH